MRCAIRRRSFDSYSTASLHSTMSRNGQTASRREKSVRKTTKRKRAKAKRTKAKGVKAKGVKAKTTHQGPQSRTSAKKDSKRQVKHAGEARK
jgi:hypothetical protein